jgi:hypothetical protein
MACIVKPRVSIEATEQRDRNERMTKYGTRKRQGRNKEETRQLRDKTEGLETA